ncbi:MAG: undecaprenyl-diphosphate phosphatase [Oscillospiraceae bacterium]|jgi:undecaprenyl-diphosphatase|nr:undecaprenyl-diphosphate phosphatase [Oscillospiraceae bacterium]
MYLLEIIKVTFIGIIQGITEWLPISSTGHMILVNDLIDLKVSKDFMDMFLVLVQLSSIMAVITLFFKKLNPFDSQKSPAKKQETLKLWYKIIIASLPAAVIGLLLDKTINDLFFNKITVSFALIIYGLLFLFIEKQESVSKIKDLNQLSYKTALLIGVFQVLALIPGTSRSGSTILGAVILGTSRHAAAEFSFFLAIPVMFGASFLKLVKHGLDFSIGELGILAVGMLTAYIVSIFAISFLLDYIKKHSFKVFGIYRIILGLIILAASFLRF